jgi:uncharacterized protein (DUF362 family)
MSIRTDPRRREFLRQVAAWTAGALIVPPLLNLGGIQAAEADAAPAPAGGPLLAVASGTDWATLPGRAVQALGGMGAFVKKGSTVVVKPNIGWDRNPEQGANTHPLIVTAVVRLCLEAGAATVKVFDRTCNNRERCYANSGIQAAIEAMADKRVQLLHVDDRKMVPVQIAKGKSVTEWSFFRDALECDHYINVPVAKHHGLSKLTLGFKNIMGVIGGKRGDIHKDIGQKLADLYHARPSTLTIIDATRILLRHGPQGGDLADVAVRNLVIASADPVAADARAAALFDLAPADIGYITAAAAAGHGEADLAKVRVVEA